MENFNRIKKRLIRNALLRSGSIGGGVAVAAACVPIAVGKLIEAEIPLPLTIGCALAFGAAVFGVLLLCLYPFQKRLAKRLDRELGTRERVQTMVEFSSDESEMAALQRKDTEERISALPKSLTSFKHPWQAIAAGALAAVTLIAAVAIPVKADNGGGGGDSSSSSGSGGISFNVSDFQLTALQQLIEYVQESKMEQGLKDLTVAELESLVESVQSTLYREEMIDLVVAAMKAVDSAVEEKNSGFDLATAIDATENAQAQLLAAAVGAVEIERFDSFYKECADGFKDITTAKEKLGAFSIALTTGLVASKVNEEDPLRAAIDGLHGALVALIPEIEYYQQQAWESQIDGTFTGHSAAFNEALSQQIVNDETRDYVIRKLKEIFGLTDKEMPELSQDYVPSNVGSEDNGENEKPGGGGLGTGEYNFPSDELVYDPATGEQVRYGVLLLDYYGRYETALAEGRIDPDLEKILQIYFDTIGEEKKDSEE